MVRDKDRVTVKDKGRVVGKDKVRVTARGKDRDKGAARAKLTARACRSNMIGSP